MQIHDEIPNVTVRLRYRSSKSYSDSLRIRILCTEPNSQLSSIRQVCNSSFLPLPTVEDLYIDRRYPQLVWRDSATENTLLLQLLLPFTAVKNLYVCKELEPCIAAALKELVGSGITDVFPGLLNIFIGEFKPSGLFQKAVGQFVAARQDLGRPVAISTWW